MPQNPEAGRKARKPIVLMEPTYVEMTPEQREQAVNALAALIQWGRAHPKVADSQDEEA
jgi:hypothetical protein